MLTFPNLFPPRRRESSRRPKHALTPPSPPPPPPPPAAITVLSVVKGAGNDLSWNFSADVTLTGGNVVELENDIDGTGMWQSPASCAQGSATSIVATYPDPPGENTPWRIAAAPSGIVQAAQVTVPQAGVIG